MKKLFLYLIDELFPNQLNVKSSSTMKRRYIYITAVFLLLSIVLFSCLRKEETISFNADVRPILNKHCLSCHGGVKQTGELSFLFEAEAFDTTASGKYAIVKGKAHRSEMIRRIKSTDEGIMMPPEGDRLSATDIQTLEKWINQGATWETHWAYHKPQKASIPTVETTPIFPIQNPIDQFIAAKMQEQGLQPSPKASKATLLRRVSLDLIGLPPSLEELENFLADDSEDAYEKVVDRLLASPRFGEHWASMWMDLARYGDSQGYQKDPYRSIWMYRDWLIQAFNDNMLFDQFTIEQLAGDLLPTPSENQLIATAFHRNTMTNDEGGTDDEEFRVAAVLDRVNTTWEVWQATTMACVQCHSHPYDPFRHEDYYTSYAFFNNTSDSDKRDDRPYIKTYSQTAKAQLASLSKNWSNDLPSIQTEMNSDRIDSIKQLLLTSPIGQIYADTLATFKRIATPVMGELPDTSSRKTHLFERGNWLVHGKEMQPDLPESLLSETQDWQFENRLDLAEWLVSPENPLTARVTVNRFWATLFGQGIVATLEDFGTQSPPPSHPELLDWLAVHFQEDLDWNIKALLKSFVLSSTYQQSAAASPEQLEIDPNNIYLSRASRIRLSAEQVRDQALAVSDLLSDKMYGPSVMPPQPEGVWQVIRNVLRWEESKGEDRYRRALYTFWRRSSPYPSFISFDSPSRELCVSRRINTNTPLQALTTLNDTVYVEAARALGQLMMEQEAPSVKAKIEYGYKKTSLQTASASTLALLAEEYNSYLTYYKENPVLAADLALGKTEDQAAFAAWSVIANIILNLDEVLVRG